MCTPERNCITLVVFNTQCSEHDFVSVCGNEEKVFRGCEDISKALERGAKKFVVLSNVLRSASPVFASILDGEWQESTADYVCVRNFKPDDFGVFLDCLSHAANQTARSGDILVFNPILLRRILPIADYFQADGLKKLIMSTVLVLLKSSIPDEDYVLNMAADMVLAIESSLPETELPAWPVKLLQKISSRIIVVSDESGVQQKKGEMTVHTRVSYQKESSVLKDLSHKTLMSCLQSFSLRVTTVFREENVYYKCKGLTWTNSHQ